MIILKPCIYRLLAKTIRPTMKRISQLVFRFFFFSINETCDTILDLFRPIPRSSHPAFFDYDTAGFRCQFVCSPQFSPYLRFYLPPILVMLYTA